MIKIKTYKSHQIEELVKILKKDGVICVPTDTVYGVCASINSKIALDRLIKVKKRPKHKQFPVMCADIEQIKNIAIIDSRAEKIINVLMPGPITLILKKKSDLPEYINNGRETIAVRMATSQVIKDLIIQNGCPIFMSSANQSGKPTCSTIEEIEKNCPTIDGILLGNVAFNKASTIVDCSSDEIKILRSGPITKEEIEEVLDS